MTAFWTIALKYPPILVRLLARHWNGPPLTTAEIAHRSMGLLDAYQVQAISNALSWDNIPFGQMKAFVVACGLDFCNQKQMHRVHVYLKSQHKFRYLQKSPEWTTVLRPLVVKFREQGKTK